MYSAHEPREDPLGFQQKRTFCFFGPEILSVVYFPLKGLSHLPQEPRAVSSSSAQDLALAQDQQGVEEGEEGGFTGGLDLLTSGGVDTLFLPLISSLRLWLDLGAISSTLVSEESSK